MPSAAPVAGAYLTLTNSGAAPDTLTGGSTPIADRIEVHQMTMGDGIGRMRPLPKGVEIAAGAQVELAPGDSTHAYQPQPAFDRGEQLQSDAAVCPGRER